MQEIILNIIGSLFFSGFTVYCWQKILKNSINNTKLKTIMLIITISASSILIQSFTPQYLKLWFTFFSLFFINKFFYSKETKISIISVLISQFLIMISELFFVLLYQLISSNNIETLYNSTYGILIINMFVGLFAFAIFHLKYLIKTFINIIQSSEEIKQREIIFYSSSIISIAIITTTASYMKWEPIYVLLFNSFVIIIFIIMSLKFMNSQTKLNNVSYKYEISIKSLREYENILDKIRVNNHENKNEFLTIRNMTKDKNIKKYIDNIIDNRIKDNEKIMKKTSKIPEGGLRATIYSKLLIMDEKKIKYSLDIAKEIKVVDLIDFDEKILLSVCKILGVFLDNAIEATESLTKKIIKIEIYTIDNYMCIDITNNYKGVIELNKISKERHTTKGDNHGYGLLLVEKILKESNNYLINEKSVNGEFFTQTLKIFLKNIK